MNSEVRGEHKCFICGNPSNWAASVSAGMVTLHGSEHKAAAVVSGKTPAQDVLVTVQLRCSKCGNVNEFVHQTPFLT